MRRVTRTLSAEELADESGVSHDRIDWLIDIRVLKPVAAGTFRFGDVFRVKMVAALLEGGFTPQQIEWAVSEGHLNLDRVDEYLPLEPGPRSQRTFAEFLSMAGPRASLLPATACGSGLTTEPALPARDASSTSRTAR